jgi:hypothetical protein
LCCWRATCISCIRRTRWAACRSGSARVGRDTDGDDISDWLELRLATPAAQAAVTQQVRVLFALDDRATCTLIMALGHVFQSQLQAQRRLGTRTGETLQAPHVVELQPHFHWHGAQERLDGVHTDDEATNRRVARRFVDAQSLRHSGYCPDGRPSAVGKGIPSPQYFFRVFLVDW